MVFRFLAVYTKCLQSRISIKTTVLNTGGAAPQSVPGKKVWRFTVYERCYSGVINKLNKYIRRGAGERRQKREREGVNPACEFQV